MVFCSLYGASDEWHQSFVPGRMVEVADWLADSIGGVIGAVVAARFFNR
jgi:VanZ family protein